MKKIALLALICVFLISCSLPFDITWKTPASVETAAPVTQAPATEAVPTAAPTEPPLPTAAPTEPAFVGVEKNLGGVYMVLPPCLAADVSGIIVNAVPYDEMNGPMAYYLQNRKISFQGYPLSGSFFDPNGSTSGGLTVYPVAEYVAMNEVIGDRLANLQNLLASHPANVESVPMVSIFGAMPVFTAQIKYLDFQNGQGVRYLTEYAQYYAPVNNYDLFYSFQGLTADGNYWVSAILPVNAAYLQVSSENPAVPADGILAPTWENNPDFDAAMDAYYVEMINKLNTTADGSFTPGLDCLDQFIQSLQISD